MDFYNSYFDEKSVNDHRYEKFFITDKQGCLSYHSLSEDGYCFFRNALLTLVQNSDLMSDFERQADTWFENYVNVNQYEDRYNNDDEARYNYEKYELIERMYDCLCNSSHIGNIEYAVRIMYSEFVSDIIENLNMERNHPNSKIIEKICEKEHYLTLYTNTDLALGYPIIEFHRECMEDDTFKLSINENRIQETSELCSRVTDKEEIKIIKQVISSLMRKIRWPYEEVVDLLEGRRIDIDVTNEQMKCAEIKGLNGIKIKGDDRYIINCDEDTGLVLESI